MSTAGAELDRLLAMGRRAQEQVQRQSAASDASRREVEAFEQLLLVRELLLLSGSGQHDAALQVGVGVGGWAARGLQRRAGRRAGGRAEARRCDSAAGSLACRSCSASAAAAGGGCCMAGA
jgi:hypothetical protein